MKPFKNTEYLAFRLGEGWELVTEVTRTARRYKTMRPNARWHKLASLFYRGTSN
jgi:hypothetical protein